MTEFARYSRQVVLREVGVNGQALLRDSVVAIVGLGGLGSPAALYLAGAGVGRLLLCDKDRVEASNLQRQILFGEADLGKPKVAAAQARVQAVNTAVQVETFDGRNTPERLLEIARAADVMLDCTDNFPTRFALNHACVAARKPLVSGAAIRFEGQLAVFDAGQADSPCYACLFGADGEAQETCEEAGILGPVAGAIGTLQALAALKLLLGRREDVGRLIVWDAWQMTFKTVVVPRDPACAVCTRP